MQLPKTRSRGLALAQRYLVVQLCLVRWASVMRKARDAVWCSAHRSRKWYAGDRRIAFSVVQQADRSDSLGLSQASTPLHGQIPLCFMEALCGRWCNVVFDLSELTLGLFRAKEFKSLEHILIGVMLARCRF
eukprot:scaffold434_cov186-Pinguiococcus_pyrenoidosus.AAC.59